MADIKVTLELDNKQYIVEIEKSKQAAKAFEKDIADSAGKIQNSFGGVITRAQALAATFLVMAQQTMAFADEMADLAAAHDTTASSVLAFGKALAANGGKAESAGRAYLELAKSIQEANSGNFKTLSTFEKLGVSIKDLGSLSETEIRNKLIKGLEQVTDPAERAAMSAIIFGKALSGVDLKKLSQSIEEISNVDSSLKSVV
jgi:sigma54-dependent transcription regulator